MNVNEYFYNSFHLDVKSRILIDEKDERILGGSDVTFDYLENETKFFIRELQIILLYSN